MAAFLTYRNPSPTPFSIDDDRMSPSPSLSSAGGGDMDMDGSDFYDSDVEGAPSVYSFSSSRDGNSMLREMHGRVCNAQNELYALPADEEEVDRIGTQHLMLKIALGSLYAADHLVKRALAPEPPAPSTSLFPARRRKVARQKTLLDVGTGAGQWALEMASEWPEVDVVGVDLAPQFRERAKTAPKNCRFEVDDVNLGLSHFQGQFDVVHSRSICNGIPNYPAYIADLLTTLRPGGILLLVEGDLQLRAETGHPMDPDQSAMQRILFSAYNALKGKGSSVDAGRQFARWLGEHVGKPGGVTFVGETEVWVPVGPWLRGNDEQTRRLNYIGELMRRDCKLFIRSLRPLLIEDGYQPETLDRWIGDTVRELDTLSVHMYCTWHYAWGEKAPE